MMKKIFLSIIILFLSMILFAQTDGFNYQAVIRDANNNIMSNTPVKLKISMLDNINGNVFYSELFDLSTNDFGLINTVIGTGNVISGNFSQINWSKKYFVKIELDINNSGDFELIGINKLQYIPYSFFSDNSNHAIYADTALYVKKPFENNKIKLSFGPTGEISTNKSSGYTVSDLSKCILDFNISDYKNINLVSFGVIAKSKNSSNNFIIELIDLNTNQVITTISNNNTDFQLLKSNNIIDNIPQNSNLAVKIKSANGQDYISLQKAYLFIENKKLVTGIN